MGASRRLFDSGLISRANLAKYWHYCRMYGVKSATRFALQRLRKARATPADVPILLPATQPLRTAYRKQIDKSVSVIIPTKNAGADLRRLIQKLRAQEGIRELEIVIVDSGSTDGTLESAKDEGVKTVTIPAEQFTHAESRNRGAEAASGEYLLFMVQDALPLTNAWIYEIMTFLQGNEVAAVSCAEYPRADSDLFAQFLIHRQYSSPGLDRDQIAGWNSTCSSFLGLRTSAHLSNVATAMHRDIFAQYRYRTAYAEDLDLGIRLIQDGHKLGFLHSTRVLHSHNRPAYYFLKRGYVDVRFLSAVFPNFVYPEIQDSARLANEILALHARSSSMPGLLDRQMFPLSVAAVVELLRSHAERGDGSEGVSVAGELRQLLGFLSNHDELRNQVPVERAAMVWPHVCKHIEGFGGWLRDIYTEADRSLAEGIASAIDKIIALHCGTHLAYLVMTRSSRQRLDDSLRQLDCQLTSGV